MSELSIVSAAQQYKVIEDLGQSAALPPSVNHGRVLPRTGKESRISHAPSGIGIYGDMDQEHLVRRQNHDPLGPFSVKESSRPGSRFTKPSKSC